MVAYNTLGWMARAYVEATAAVMPVLPCVMQGPVRSHGALPLHHTTSSTPDPLCLFFFFGSEKHSVARWSKERRPETPAI